MSGTSEALDVARRFVDALERRDGQALSSILHEDVVLESPFAMVLGENTPGSRRCAGESVHAHMKNMPNVLGSMEFTNVVWRSTTDGTMLIAGKCYLELFHYSRPDPIDSSAASEPYRNGYTHFCVDVTEIKKEAERLARLGLTFDRPHGQGRPVDVGIVKAIYGRDPEGNLIELQETASDCEFDARHLPKASLA